MRSFGPDHAALKALVYQHFGIRVYGFDYEYRNNSMMHRGDGIKISLRVLSPDHLLSSRFRAGSVIVSGATLENNCYTLDCPSLFIYDMQLLYGPLTNQFLKVTNHANHPKRHPRGRRAVLRDYRRFKVEAAGAYRGNPARPPANGRRLNVFGRSI